MNDVLSPKTHRWLSDIHDKLRRQSCVEKKLQLKATQEFKAWCDEHEIDLDAHLGSQVLRFDRELIVKVQELLDSLGHLPLGESSKGKTAEQQAKQSYQEDKGAGERPRAHRVLLNLAPLGTRLGISDAAREICDIDWRDLNLEAFDALVMIENLDSFYAFVPDSQALAVYRQPLVVYRGDTYYGGGFSRLAKAWGDGGKLHLGLGDFDPRGVGIVLGSGAMQMLLPPLEWLREHATQHHVPSEQLPYQSVLRKHREQLPDAHPLRGYLALLLDEQRGLRQQWFSEQLEPVPLH
ncbi:hypothetical protein SAMN05421509_103102 [Chromohalobacter canadensis]|uniref:DUF7281 domain-containing protein n=1 Tax=Chromohalobacter canadensis TaxID=141389 RepID=A0A285VJ10_9GAMM|nr:hypothetical protein [Chromohalobacter canadensis]SOC54059.1 hypothetical protein SAMN05421509_103102 [Chromohalobacter canadensis]